MTLATLALVCIGHAWFIEPYRLSVSRVEITSAKLPRGTAPIRIVQLSDLHSDPKARLESRLADVIAGERPDLKVHPAT